MNHTPRDSEGIDPSDLPVFTTSAGLKIPGLGLGTFGSDSVSADTVAAAVIEAVHLGYRHIDCASVYGNEAQIGGALRTLREEGLPRDQLWITSKLWNDKHAEADVIPQCEKSLKDLGLDYLDLYLIHWPFPNFHPPKTEVTWRGTDAKPFVLERFLKTWRQLEILQKRGLVRAIGTSNMTVPKLKAFLPEVSIRPAVNEMELHPHFQQPELFDFVRSHGMVPIGYSPLGSPGRPERDRTADDSVDLEDPVIVKIAADHGVHPAAVCVAWAVQRGQIPIPFSVKRKNLVANLKAAAHLKLNNDEMAALAKVDRNCRLIKGQVFLWKDGQSWEDLWDLNGTITPG
jgi:diketogulonate reductase-like aldo/keto reductase